MREGKYKGGTNGGKDNGRRMEGRGGGKVTMREGIDNGGKDVERKMRESER